MASSPQRPAQRSEQRVGQRMIMRTGSNRFEFNRDLIPQGMSYEWKRCTLYGQEDTEHLVDLEQNGWEPVPSERHPELSGRRAVAGSKNVRGGLMLMERPIEITDEARDLDTFAARHQVAAQVQRLGLEGKRAAGKGIRTSYEAPTAESQQIPD
jgi:hypothetical protein